MVKLVKIDASKKFALLKAIRAIDPALSLVDAKAKVDKLPSVLAKDVPPARAKELQAQLLEAGGEVEVGPAQ